MRSQWRNRLFGGGLEGGRNEKGKEYLFLENVLLRKGFDRQKSGGFSTTEQPRLPAGKGSSPFPMPKGGGTGAKRGESTGSASLR